MQPWLRSAGLELNVLKIRHTMKGPAFALGGAGLVPDWMHPAYDDGCNELWQGTHQRSVQGLPRFDLGFQGIEQAQRLRVRQCAAGLAFFWFPKLWLLCRAPSTDFRSV